MDYIVISNHCGTQVDSNTYNKKEAELLAKKETENAKELGFDEVTFSAVEINSFAQSKGLK